MSIEANPGQASGFRHFGKRDPQRVRHPPGRDRPGTQGSLRIRCHKHSETPGGHRSGGERRPTPPGQTDALSSPISQEFGTDEKAAGTNTPAAVLTPTLAPGGRGLLLAQGQDLQGRSSEIMQGRSDRGSSPWSRPRQSPGQTSRARPNFHRLPPKPGVGSLNRRRDRPACRST
jgi:hypothetical protein